MAMLDKRRNDQRDCILRYPFWLDSKLITYNDDGYEVVLFSFPAAYGAKQWLIHECCCEIVVAWAGTSPTLDLGLGTIPTNDSGDGATVTTVDADEFIPNADITEGSTGYYWAATGDFVTAKAAGTGTGRIITCADTDVPVVFVSIGGSSLTAGQAVFHMLVSVVPFEL